MPATTWTAPSSPGANTTATSAWAAIVSDNLKFLKNPDRVRVYKSTATTINASAWEPIDYDSEDYDSGGLHTGGAASRLTAVVDGWYDFKGQVEWEASGSGRRDLQVRKNDTTSDATGGTRWARNNQTAPGADECYQQIVGDVYLAAGDHIRLFAWQNSGGGLDIQSGSGVSWFAMTWAGD